MAYIDGDDFINGAILSYQQGNRMKNNWRGAAAPANIQPGMLFSKSLDDKLYHAGAGSAQEEVLQLSRSQDVSPTFLYETLLGRNLKTWWNFEDFVSQSQPTVYVLGIWVTNITGDATVSNIAATALRPGIRKLATGTGTTNIASMSTGGIWYPVQFLFGGGVYTIEGDINIPVLSSATETYALRFGFGDVYNGDFVDGAYFEYYNVGGATPTPDWYKCTASNSTRTKTDTTIVATAGATTWNRLKIVVNADASSVEYFINGVSAGVVTTNIPSGTGRGTGAVFHIVKSAGTTECVANIDWAWLHIDLTTSR